MSAARSFINWKTVEYIVLAASFLILAAGLLYLGRGSVMRIYEETAIRVDPTPTRAYLYGLRHFNASLPAGYDIERAYQFFLLAEKLDPTFLGVNHELARIEFLKGRYSQALVHINEELTLHPKEDANAYYVRALIYGYQGEYMKAAADYEEFFTLTPANWAGINDYSWVLLKAGLPDGAHDALEWGLKQWPENAWLLNNDATALYELGRYAEAKTSAEKAEVAIGKLTIADWLNAYPGNDPKIASEGLSQLKKEAAENLAKIRGKES